MELLPVPVLNATEVEGIRKDLVTHIRTLRERGQDWRVKAAVTQGVWPPPDSEDRMVAAAREVGATIKVLVSFVTLVIKERPKVRRVAAPGGHGASVSPAGHSGAGLTRAPRRVPVIPRLHGSFGWSATRPLARRVRPRRSGRL